MSEPRDSVNAGRAEVLTRVRETGGNVEDITREERNPRVVQTQLLDSLNGAYPTLSRQRLQVDHPPKGSVDGTNTDYTLTRAAFGNNIKVLWTAQATGIMSELTRSSNSAPVAGTFFYDGNVTIRLGFAPTVDDGLAAIYIPRS